MSQSDMVAFVRAVERACVERGLRLDLANGLGSHTPQVASPLRLSATPVDYRLAPPLLGEHSEAILQRLLGLDAAQIASLRAAGVV